MTGTYQDGKLLYNNPYKHYMGGMTRYAWDEVTNQLVETIIKPETEAPKPSPTEYEIHNPHNFVLTNGEEYEFELIYFDDGDVAELINKTGE
jgi:hypothetical protein